MGINGNKKNYCQIQHELMTKTYFVPQGTVLPRGSVHIYTKYEVSKSNHMANKAVHRQQR